MNCCDANGDCNQGRDCPVRKQRIKEVNDAYINGKIDNNPYDETLGSFSDLVTVIMVVACITLLFFVICWGML
ncbi:hypothetical protein UFOVP1024_31 [uncultured Caudovirales phage]|uniref:Uncharacterized protein n=1 Tax=uncultured Caudovirales phage TaxID=2100421 RepID=A0A6J5PU60_9CAUD|nr:hypothetical protein UFOVP949_10 [uncultured Caudovirales phage]CAB4179039.1 hypothetical protein UFOVP1024_31 [uncultured Caudovirales phage]